MSLRPTQSNFGGVRAVMCRLLKVSAHDSHGGMVIPLTIGIITIAKHQTHID